jgi:hypothetical protein
MDSGPAPESASRNDRVWQLEALAQTPPKLGLICGLWNTGVAHARGAVVPFALAIPSITVRKRASAQRLSENQQTAWRML